MNEVVLRFFSDQHNIEPDFLESLKSFASQHGYRMAEEGRTLSADDSSQVNLQNFMREAEAYSKRIGPIASDSANDIRDMRDRR